MKSKTTIEVNGKHYDAVTGALVGGAAPTQPHRGQNIDGFFRSRTNTTPTQKSPAADTAVLAAPAPAPKPQPHKQPNRTVNHAKHHAQQTAKTVDVRVKSGVQHSQKLTVRRTPAAPNHTKAVKPQSSQTLMRTAVKRPVPSFHKQAHTKAALQHSVPSLIVAKKSAVTLDEQRLARAQNTPQSPLVAHHSDQIHTIQPQLASLSVQPVPEPSATPPATTPAPTPTNKPTDIFEHAIANADHYVDTQARKAHRRKKGCRHVVSMAAGTLALVIIAGFAFYQNSPGMQFKVAGYRAGVATHLPNVAAAGFDYEGASVEDDKLVIGFSSTSGNFRMNQQTTNLSGQDVINTISSTDASGYPNYRSVRSGDVTIYRFGNTDATWVKDGTWYTVNGSGDLTDQQVESLVRNT